MPDERRYKDEEVEEIFDLASRSAGVEKSESVHKSGLTLAEPQEVGHEAGLEPERIAEAAASLERRPNILPARKLLGLPVSVARVVELPRAPTDHEWELLVAELRATFGAKGKATSSGSLREWSVGNLHACVEPTETGYRLRVSTLKGSALALRSLGAVGLVLAVVVALILVVDGRVDELMGIPLVFGLMGGAALALNVLTLPRWAREREQQMEHMTERASALLAGEPRGIEQKD